MSIDEFKASLERSAPPAHLSIPLQALWWDGRGNWEKAHDALQADASQSSAWVHAYLHRKEGDNSNARYWYNRAARAVSTLGLEAEWQEISQALLAETQR
jgi:hypothetical protein